jgi:hypothetical protein
MANEKKPWVHPDLSGSPRRRNPSDTNIPSGDFDSSLYSDRELRRLEKARYTECFVATAVYGDRDAEPVVVLRGFRDRVLRRFRLGRMFIAVYYRYGESWAEMLDTYPSLRVPVKRVLDLIVRSLRRKPTRSVMRRG